MIYSKVYAPARVIHKHIRASSAHIGRLAYVTRTQLMRKHPGDFMSSLMLSASTSSSSAIGHNTVLKDVLDQRLPPPQNELADGVAHVAKLAFACLQTDPHFRPTMQQVSTELTTRWPPLPKLFCTIELEDELVHGNVHGWIFTVYFPVKEPVAQLVIESHTFQEVLLYVLDIQSKVLHFVYFFAYCLCILNAETRNRVFSFRT